MGKSAKSRASGKSGHKGPGKDSTSAAALQTAERHAQWVEDRKAGRTYREISERDGVAVSTVQEAVVRRLRETVAEPARELRELELQRYDALHAATWEPAKRGDLDAIETQLKIAAARRKLLGLDAPQKFEDVTPPREALWESVRAWLRDPTPELEAVLRESGWTRS